MVDSHVEKYPVAWTPPAGPSLAERLERHELVAFPVCPFPLPEGDDHRFLLEQRLSRFGHKNISHDPRSGRTTGCQRQAAEHTERLGALLAAFSRTATAWLATVLPGYAAAWELDRVSLRPEEEATRQLRQTARDDLLHIDAFPTRPTHGRRILRIFVNINPSEPRVWVTTDPLPRLLERYRKELGLLPGGGANLTTRVREGVLRLLISRGGQRSAYDAFMLRFHDFLKRDDAFQERCAKRYWTFPPRSAWLAFTDAVCHAALRGRHALDHSWFVPTETLLWPHAAPIACLERLCGAQPAERAA